MSSERSDEIRRVRQCRQRMVATLMQQAGYRTAAIGKWHLGLGSGNIDWNQPISPAPADVGFDYSFIMAATGDRVPCVYVENGQVKNLDPQDLDDEAMKKVVAIVNRRQAIKTACMMAKAGDVILVAGKGHEDYQDVKGVKYHFDDKEEIRACF